MKIQGVLRDYELPEGFVPTPEETAVMNKIAAGLLTQLQEAQKNENSEKSTNQQNDVQG